jgi:hypothetical protein
VLSRNCDAADADEPDRPPNTACRPLRGRGMDGAFRYLDPTIVGFFF